MKNYNAKDVDAYFAGADIKARPHLIELRKIIKSAIPNVEEKIAWGVPMYSYQGLLAGFAAHKNHASIWFPLAMLQNKDREELEKRGYITAKKTIQIQFNQKVPTQELKRLLKAQAKMNEEKQSKREK